MKRKKRNNICVLLILEYTAAICAIVGISLSSIFGPLINMFPVKQRYDAISKIENIGVEQNKEYIDQVLGYPKINNEINYNLIAGGEIKGYKAIYDDKYFLLICYFREDNSLLGYFIVSKDKKFKPNMLEDILYCKDDIDVFYKPINECFHFNPKKRLLLVMVGELASGSRKDISHYYMEYYYHHLDTNNLYIGVGVSDFGYLYNQNYFSDYIVGDKEANDLSFKSNLHDNNITLEYMSVDDIEQKYNTLTSGKINTISAFVNDNDINVPELLKEELEHKMSITRIEYSYIK